MKHELLEYLCDPTDGSDLELLNPTLDSQGNIITGTLKSKSGKTYPIRTGVPRFIDDQRSHQQSVDSFGDEWNYFNFDSAKPNWLDHTVKNTFGSTDFFKNKIIVDAGAGSGMQSVWMAQAGAKLVIGLELSHAVDGIIAKNTMGYENIQIVQCSIDNPPIKKRSIPDLVICHNVIQHTPSVENTARALWSLVAPGGEFAFNCYPKNDKGVIRKIRLQFYYALRGLLSNRSFKFILTYSKIVGALSVIPVLGTVLDKMLIVVKGESARGTSLILKYKYAVMNTFDCYGSHAYQHLKTDEEIKNLVNELQPKAEYVKNMDSYFLRPQPVGCALRIVNHT